VLFVNCFSFFSCTNWSQVEVKQGTMTMRGKPVPAWAVPAGLFGAFATLAMFAF
jgi:hypothetical protein